MSTLPLEEAVFSFVDTETTGLSPAKGGRVCELAILQSKGGRRLDSFLELINPGVPVEPGAYAVHRISNEMLRGKPGFSQIAARAAELLNGTVMVCHNAPFDVSFLSAEFTRAGVEMPSVPVLCTLKLARRHFGFERNSLGAIAAALGLENDGWHRAGGDAAVLEKIFAYFLKEFSMRGVADVGGLLKL